jgi:HlyD family secretion protein
MKHRLVPFIIILLVVGAVGGGYWYFDQHPSELIQLKLKFGLISETEATGVHSASGFIEAEEIDAAMEIKGRITRIAVDEGDFVEAGQILVELDTALLDAEMRQAEAKIDVAEAQLAKINAGVRAEEIAKAKAAVTVAEANAAAAYTQWQDTITLRDNPQELDIQIDAAKTVLDLAELSITHAIPFKDAAEATWDLRHQQWDYNQQSHRFCRSIPGTGQSKCVTIHLPEGVKQQSGVRWNYAGADMWSAWVDLNSAVAQRDDAEIALNDLVRMRNDPQEADVKVAQAESAYQAALAEVDVAKAQLEILQVGARAEQIAVAEAQVKQAEANLAALNVQRDKHSLGAPQAGWIVEQVGHEGEMAVPGAPLLTLADLSKVTLTVYVPEPDIDLISLGQKVDVFVDTFPGEPFPGRIIFISDEAEFTPKNVQTKEERKNTVFGVKIKLENQDQRLKPGMPADAILAEGPKL